MNSISQLYSLSMTEHAGSAKPGDPYTMKCTDSCGNHCFQEMQNPAAISEFSRDPNTIDRHNQGSNTTNIYKILCSSVLM